MHPIKVTNLLPINKGISIPEGIDAFYGIRYAAPPLNNLRFQAPQPPLLEPQMIGANIIPNICPQANLSHPLFTDDYKGNEDCLFLNIFKPTKAKEGNNLPVMVYIRISVKCQIDIDEGGFSGGSNLNHDPTFLISLTNNSMIAVTIQYRVFPFKIKLIKLGAFGFLSSSQVFQKGVLNAGLLDQKFALEWIQKNIHRFGGDKDQVTIWGLSAGGGSVIDHIVAYNGTLGTSLFKGAIANSPYLSPTHGYNDIVPERNYARFVKEAGCADAVDTFECIVGKDSETLMKANAMVSTSGPFGTFTWLPVSHFRIC
jgi:carboxylesterase type B